MDQMFQGLDTETQLLVGIGAAVASGCIPCLEKMTLLAEKAAVDPKKLRIAAIIGQFVKDQPAAHMKGASDKLLGTHLQAAVEQVACPADTAAKGNCGCGTNTSA